MSRPFSSLIIKIGIIIILAEIIVLAFVGVFYVERFSEAIDKRIERQVTLPSILMDSGLLNVASLVEQDTMRDIVGETLLDGWAIDRNRNIIASFNPDYRGLAIDDIVGINGGDFNFVDPQSHVNSTPNFITSTTPIYRNGDETPRLFIYIKVSTQEAEAEKASIRNRYLLGSILTIFATSLIIIVSFRWIILNRITDTLKVLEKVDAGDLTARTSGNLSGDELGILRQRINSTIETLEMRDKDRELAEIERLEHEHVLNILNKEQEWNASIQQMIKVFSHELRTPLSVIQSSVDLLTRYSENFPPERKAKKFATVSAQVKYMTQILDDVVQVVQNAFGHDNFNPHIINLEQICSVTVKELQETVGRKHKLVMVTDKQIRQVYADEKLITRILINLLSNAIKYSPNGSEIRLELCNEDGIQLSVIDQGMGISKEDQVRIFDTFYRTDNVHHINGTGLGLSIVRDCVRLHGGEISLESELGAGSTFRILLPLKVIESHAEDLLLNHS